MRRVFICFVLLAAVGTTSSARAQPFGRLFDRLVGTPTLVEEWRYTGNGAEIVAYDSKTRRVFVSNSAESRVDVLQASDKTSLGSLPATNVNSVDAYDGLVAVAVDSGSVGTPGSVLLYDAETLDLLGTASAGFLPDMVTFTPDGKYVLVANEGEPNDDYDNDPVGSISMIDVTSPSSPVTTDIGFSSFNSEEASLKAAGVRIFGPGASVAQDLEPEYITVSEDSSTAYVICQENNATAIVDLGTKSVVSINPLGYKDHTKKRNAFDASNRDDAINIQRWPTRGMYQPDSIASFRIFGVTLVVTANEGDARDYDGFSEEERVKDLNLDASAFPNAEELQEDENLGRLKTTTATGDLDGDGDFDEIYSYGARSFSIWLFKADGSSTQIFDSGDDFEQITAALIPADFNSNEGEADSFDNRSDDKGPEPEALAVGTDLGQTLGFIGLERVGGIMLYDLTNPFRPRFLEYERNSTDVAPEGIDFISRARSPFREPAIVVASEVSGTTTFYRIKRQGGFLSFLLND